jgi:tripartite-type tricarboxylate transporter receptor subunit TctC
MARHSTAWYLTALCAVAVAALPAGTAHAASDYPNRPIQLIVPYAPGGVTDQVARIVAQGMENKFGQRVLVINRAGASTVVGTQSVARAAPDGYTLIMVSVPFAANVTLEKDLPYAQSDFAPITTVASTPNILVVNPTTPVNSVADLVAYIKARPGQINYATFGIGSSAHLTALQFETLIKEKMQAVHYRGGGPAAVAVMTGEVQLEFGGALSVAGGVGAGKLKPLAVTARHRINFYPDVPTFVESGFDLVQGTWFGLLAPAQTPEPIIRQIYEAAAFTMEKTEAHKTIVDSGTEVLIQDSPADFAKFIANETKRWAGILGSMAVEKQ